MSRFLSARRTAHPELMDEPRVDPERLGESLRALDRVNRHLGGIRSLRNGLLSLAGDAARASLLDLGVGNGDVPRRLTADLAGRGLRLWWAGVDAHPRVLDAARRRAAELGSGPVLVLGDGRALPFADRSFDFACATLTLHHLGDRDCVHALAEMGRVARRGVLVSDLERRLLSYLGARALALTLWRRDPITRHDGPVSVVRGFTAEELRRLALQAGLEGVRVQRFFPFRLLLTARPRARSGAGP